MVVDILPLFFFDPLIFVFETDGHHMSNSLYQLCTNAEGQIIRTLEILSIIMKKDNPTQLKSGQFYLGPFHQLK